LRFGTKAAVCRRAGQGTGDALAFVPNRQSERATDALLMLLHLAHCASETRLR
jgi:hypothetical protein